MNNTVGAGGSIRIDALSLTIGANAQIESNANQLISSGGGGSGGCILLNGVHTFMDTNYSMAAKGGPGQLYNTSFVESYISSTVTLTTTFTPTPTSTPVPGGGGGAGGRIKVGKYTSFSNLGGTITLSGGPGGGGSAKDGGIGTSDFFSAPTPTPPQLLAPSDGQVVGQSPTFSFAASDPMQSQFLKYEIEIATDYSFSFSYIVHANSQLSPGSGWAGREYFRSNEGAYYYMPDGILNTATTYYWRMRVTNSNDNTGWSAYSAIRQFLTITTPNNKPLKPLLLYPPNAQNNVSKIPALQVLGADPDGNTLTFTVLLSQNPSLLNPDVFQPSYPGWDKVEYPSQYNYYGITATCQIQNTTEYPDALQPGNTYYWRVTVIDQYQESSNSDIGSFTVVRPPDTPGLIRPAKLEVVTEKNPLLELSSQSPTASPLSYQLELSSDNFQTVITFMSGSSPGWSKKTYASGETAALRIPSAYTLVPGKVYSWRAEAYDQANDNWSSFSDVNTFEVITPPLVPGLISPEEGFEAPDQSLAFRFSAVSESGNTLTYRLELSADQFQTALYVFDQMISSGGWDQPAYASGATALFTWPDSANLERGRTYAWRVIAWDGVSWGTYSDSRTFTITNTLKIKNVKLYPNPAVNKDTLQVAMELSVDAEVTLRVFNLLGKELKQYAFTARGGPSANIFTLDIGSYACGTYLCHLEVKSKFGTQKTVKRFSVVN